MARRLAAPGRGGPLGAGAVLEALGRRGWEGFSPEARLARGAYASVADYLPDALRDCASGRELVANGYGADVDIAAEADASTAVPVLADGAFARAG